MMVDALRGVRVFKHAGVPFLPRLLYNSHGKYRLDLHHAVCNALSRWTYVLCARYVRHVPLSSQSACAALRHGAVSASMAPYLLAGPHPPALVNNKEENKFYRHFVLV